MKKHFFLSFLAAAFLAGCATSGSKNGGTQADPHKMALLDEALQDLANESYTSASMKLDQLLKKNPVDELDLVVLYNSGVAQEGLKNCRSAAEKYRSAARIANDRFKKIAALSLYRLGFAYDCLGDPKKSIVAFLDARKKAEALPPDVAQAELPARLAAAYASLGRKKEALYFFNEASAGLKRLLARSESSRDKELAAKTMYAMGRLSQTSRPLIFVKMLSMQQPFLLQAIELNAGSSSEKAKSDLKNAYHQILAEKPSDKNSQREYYIQGLKASRELQKLRLPSSAPLTEDLFKVVSNVENGLQRRLAALAETVEKTPQEQKRESLKKENPRHGK
jgi:tetratricopeptide (TPR) repeat protein